MATLPELLNALVSLNGSDLHITTNTPPQVRVHGQLQTLDLPVLGPAETKALAYSVLTDAQKKRFEESLELDFSFGISGQDRFRCNVEKAFIWMEGLWSPAHDGYAPRADLDGANPALQDVYADDNDVIGHAANS